MFLVFIHPVGSEENKSLRRWWYTFSGAIGAAVPGLYPQDVHYYSFIHYFISIFSVIQPNPLY